MSGSTLIHVSKRGHRPSAGTVINLYFSSLKWSLFDMLVCVILCTMPNSDFVTFKLMLPNWIMRHVVMYASRHTCHTFSHPDYLAKYIFRNNTCHCGHYSDVVMGAMASQITSLTIVYSTVYSGTYQRKHKNSVSLAFVRGIHRWPVNSPHKRPVTRKMFPFDDVIMWDVPWAPPNSPKHQLN